MKKILAFTLVMACVFSVIPPAFARAAIDLDGGFTQVGSNYEYWGRAKVGLSSSVTVTVQLQYNLTSREIILYKT